ncbi:hypothetical protein D3C80_2214250 [compost metagenome]
MPNALRDELQETVCPIFQKEQARHSPRTYLQPVGAPTLSLLDREHKTFRWIEFALVSQSPLARL